MGVSSSVIPEKMNDCKGVTELSYQVVCSKLKQNTRGTWDNIVTYFSLLSYIFKTPLDFFLAWKCGHVNDFLYKNKTPITGTF